jgi:hypothetical protein
LHILGKFLLIKRNYIFKLSIFVEKFKFISDPELPGSGMIFPDPDPAKSFRSHRILGRGERGGRGWGGAGTITGVKLM